MYVKGVMYVTDTENADVEMLELDNRTIMLVEKEEKIYFNGIYNVYQISGQTNLSKEEVIKVLEKIKLK